VVYCSGHTQNNHAPEPARTGTWPGVVAVLKGLFQLNLVAYRKDYKEWPGIRRAGSLRDQGYLLYVVSRTVFSVIVLFKVTTIIKFLKANVGRFYWM
jgi:hypothetical protein